jgi:hypothetical protein
MQLNLTAGRWPAEESRNHRHWAVATLHDWLHRPSIGRVSKHQSGIHQVLFCTGLFQVEATPVIVAIETAEGA